MATPENSRIQMRLLVRLEPIVAVTEVIEAAFGKNQIELLNPIAEPMDQPEVSPPPEPLPRVAELLLLSLTVTPESVVELVVAKRTPTITMLPEVVAEPKVAATVVLDAPPFECDWSCLKTMAILNKHFAVFEHPSNQQRQPPRHRNAYARNPRRTLRRLHVMDPYLPAETVVNGFHCYPAVNHTVPLTCTAWLELRMKLSPGCVQYHGLSFSANVIEDPLPVKTNAPDSAVLPSLNVMFVAPPTVNAIPYTLIGPFAGAETTVLSPDAEKLIAALLTPERRIGYRVYRSALMTREC